MVLLQQFDVRVYAQAHASALLDHKKNVCCQLMPAGGMIAAR
jgi:hypothetical protein